MNESRIQGKSGLSHLKYEGTGTGKIYVFLNSFLLEPINYKQVSR